MNELQLNLARKWRSRNFDEIVGQDLSVRMLKNSLYLGHFFPVYLFSGQRGCGKTSTARVFATAINCEKLSDFQGAPKKYTIPCLTCRSCISMIAGKHPDFIEIDAASHTGVDNVRQIIDAASFMPLLGTKKIYLIDEAHMLSKAAFNAFLKILEEPPPTAIFILATTDPHKILQTVLSRCFQLFFNSIDTQCLHNHLAHICKKESIEFEDDALQIIINKAEGSCRDAINILEQARFSHPKITRDAVKEVLGHIDDKALLELLDVLLHKDMQELMTCIQKITKSSYSIESLWHDIVSVLRTGLYLKYGVSLGLFPLIENEIEACVKDIPASILCDFLHCIYEHERLFIKTTAQLPLLEMVLLRLFQLRLGSSEKKKPISEPIKSISNSKEKKSLHSSEQENNDIALKKVENNVENENWNTFLKAITTCDEPILISVFKKSEFKQYIPHQKVVISLPKDFQMFQDICEQHKKIWEPLLFKSFSKGVALDIQFDRETEKKKNSSSKAQQEIKKKNNITPPRKVNSSSRPMYSRRFKAQPRGKKVDISDTTVWKKANALLKIFPGTIIEIEENDV